jgi:hypothetical protein
MNADDLPIRGVVNLKYEAIASTIFECLQQMAKMGEESTVNPEDKDQLNYHVVLIGAFARLEGRQAHDQTENMSHLVTVIQDLRVPALGAVIKRAKDVYDENLSLYIRMVLRRPLGRLYVRLVILLLARANIQAHRTSSTVSSSCSRTRHRTRCRCTRPTPSRPRRRRRAA